MGSVDGATVSLPYWIRRLAAEREWQAWVRLQPPPRLPPLLQRERLLWRMGRLKELKSE
jgi:hypothetical protein